MRLIRLGLLIVALGALAGCPAPGELVCSRANEFVAFTGPDTSTNFTDPSGGAAGVDVQHVTGVMGADGVTQFCVIDSQDIPEYTVTITDDLRKVLEEREFADVDYPGPAHLPAPAVVTGAVFEFGDDLGFRDGDGDPMTVPTCTMANEGFGYWPPGPACPTVHAAQFKFPERPAAAVPTDECRTDAGRVGIWVNGVSMFNWWDGQSWKGEDVWHRVAPIWERADVDICNGHGAAAAPPATGAEYHHHSYPGCLGELLLDRGAGTSPILGYAADGFPVLGPWMSAGLLAESCWKLRDYSEGSPTGCPKEGRTCLLKNQLEPSLGVDELVDENLYGPDMDETAQATSWHTIDVVSGAFAEDHFFDRACSTRGGPYLDEHNGHVAQPIEMTVLADFLTFEHGYHYHTVRSGAPGGPYGDVFPFIIGPTLKGVVHDDSNIKCK